MERNTLYKFFEGLTSTEEEKHIRQWMESSPENRETLLKERKFFDASVLLAENVPAKGKTAVSLRRAALGQWIRAAAIAALALTGSYFYYNRPFQKESLAMQTISVPAGQRVNLLLSDGTNVWLNARTTLKYPVSFNGKERALELDGEAYFDVAEDRKKPFVVHTAKGEITALGTGFNVEAYSSGAKFVATLMHGSIRVKLNGDPGEGLLLTPDRKAVWEGSDSLRVETVDDYTVYRWVEGLICFKDESILAIMKEFEKYYGVRIYVRNQQILKYEYTGKFRHTDGVDYALRVLQRDVSFKYVRDDESQIIYIE
ncbi:MAG: FecR domain-containing protein [Tannerellaceae bacterium]|jgi:ferric-dicitrate binding protein FerR (iron transport regulator)|nr:FecR domain-containing protein [Tannerellaceae bacterium]